MAVIMVVCALIGIFLYAVWHTGYWVRRGISGPKSTPFFGSMLQLIDPEEPATLQIAEWTKKFGTFFGYQHGWKNVLVISDAAAIREVLVEKFGDFKERRASPNLAVDANSAPFSNVFTSHGERWVRLRSASNTALSSPNLRNIFPVITDSARRCASLFRQIAETDVRLDALSHFREFSMDVTSRLAFGQTDSRQFRSPLVWIAVGVFRGFGRSPFCHLSWIAPFLAAFCGKVGFVFELIFGMDFVRLLLSVKAAVQRRRVERKIQNLSNSPRDLIDAFLDAELTDTAKSNRRRLSTDEIVAQCTVILLAGFETTANTLSILLWYLARHPEAQRRLRDEIAKVCGTESADFDQLSELRYCDAVINETLRLHPIGTFAIARICNRDSTIGGVAVEAGTHIHCDIHSHHRNPEIWGLDADEFRPERWLEMDSGKRKEFYGFGGGPRHCVGVRLATIEMKCVLAELFGQNPIRFSAGPALGEDERNSEAVESPKPDGPKMWGITTIGPVDTELVASLC